MTDKVEVKIVGDESSAQAALRRSAAAVTEASNVMRDRLGALGQTSKTAFNGMGADADHAADQIEAAKSRISNSMEGMKSSLDDAGRTIKNTFVEGARQADDAGKIWEDRGQRVGESLRSSLATVKGALLGYVAALGTQAVGDAIAKGLEYASSLGEQAQQLGITSDALQEYHYAASQVGISNGEMSQALSQLTRRIGEAAAGNRSEADAFTKLGIAVKGANGEILNAADAIPLIADRLENLESPAERAAVLMDLFGRSGQKLESMLQGGSAAVNGLRNAAHELGIVLSEDQIAHADETADRLSAVKQVLEARIAGVVSDNANAILALANALASVVDWAGKAADAYRRFKLEQGLREAQAMQTGWFRSDADRAKGANDEQLYKYELAKLNGTVDKTGSFRDYRTAGLDIASPSNFLGSTPRAAGAPRAARGGGGGSSGPSIAEQLEQELSAKKAAWAKEQDAQGTFQSFSLESEASYWKAALGRADLSSKDRYAIEQKWIAARQGLKREEIASSIGEYREQIAAAGQNYQERIKILNEQHDYVVRMFGKESNEARTAAQAITQAEREQARQREQIEENLARAKEQMALATIDEAEASARFDVEMGRTTNSQLLALERQFENQRFELRRANLQRQQNATDPQRDPVLFKQISTQLEQLEQQHQLRLNDIERRNVLLRTNIQRQGIQSISQSWAQTLAQMATLQMTFADGIKGIWQGVQQMIANALATIIQQWLQQQITALVIGKTAQSLTGVAQVTSNAAVAGSAAYAATAGIPIVGPALAPAAAASAFAGAMAFAPIASAKGGWDIPDFGGTGVDGQGGQMAVVHPREMVLPADLADIVRNGGMGGGISVHISAMDGQSVKRVLMDNKGSLAEALRKHLRDGGR